MGQSVVVEQVKQTTGVAAVGTGKRPLNPQVATLMPDHEIGVREWNELSRQFDRLERAGVVRYVLDFTDVSHLDYRTVRPLVERAERARELCGDLKLAGLSPYLAAIFRVAGAHTSFECFKDPIEAGAAFDRSWNR